MIRQDDASTSWRPAGHHDRPRVGCTSLPPDLRGYRGGILKSRLHAGERLPGHARPGRGTRRLAPGRGLNQPPCGQRWGAVRLGATVSMWFRGTTETHRESRGAIRTSASGCPPNARGAGVSTAVTARPGMSTRAITSGSRPYGFRTISWPDPRSVRACVKRTCSGAGRSRPAVRPCGRRGEGAPAGATRAHHVDDERHRCGAVKGRLSGRRRQTWVAPVIRPRPIPSVIWAGEGRQSKRSS